MSRRHIAILSIFLGSRILLALLSVFILRSVGINGYNYTHNLHLEGNRSATIEVFYRWDAVWYLDIAQNGYLQQRDNPNYARWRDAPFATGFFPLLPLIIRVVYLLAGHWALAGILTGLLLGAGFIIGGYCPGTSIVASVSGKIDGLLFMIGILVGSFLFTLNYDALKSFADSYHMGRVLMGEFFEVPSGVVVFLVALMAIGAFFAVGKVEALVNGAKRQ